MDADAGVSESRDADGTAVSSSDTDSHVIAENLTVSYSADADPAVAVDRVDLPRGEITALIGPNGSGKSTVLETLANHIEPEAGGRVLLDGEQIDSYGRREFARELGHLSQENTCPESLSVEDLVYHGRYPHRGFFDSVSADDERAVERAIELTGIDHLRSTPVGSLSGGQKQLVWIAVVLAQETDVLLLDEPTTFLDMRHRLQVLDVVRTLNERQDITVGIVLHDIEQAARFADYVVALDDGTVYDWGPPAEVVTEELLATAFGVDAAVSTDPDIRIVPKQPL